MKIFSVLLLIATSSFLHFQTMAQGIETTITEINVDGKTTQKNYRVFFQLQNSWVEAVRTPHGFMVPDALSEDEYLTVLVKVGKYQLEFSDVHISKFKTSWVVGIDKPPFSEKFVEPEQASSFEIVYWIEFTGLRTTRMIVKIKKE